MLTPFHSHPLESCLRPIISLTVYHRKVHLGVVVQRVSTWLQTGMLGLLRVVVWVSACRRDARPAPPGDAARGRSAEAPERLALRWRRRKRRTAQSHILWIKSTGSVHFEDVLLLRATEFRVGLHSLQQVQVSDLLCSAGVSEQKAALLLGR